MTKFMIPPLPEVVLTDADETQLSLRSFQIIIIVEPDPETWMLVNNNDELVIELFNTGLAAELDPESELYLSNEKTVVHPPDIPEPNVIWLRYFSDGFFAGAAQFCNAIFNFFDYDDTANLKIFMGGIKFSHPDWKVAIVGGLFEDDVIRIANLVSKTGFQTTVLSRQCISRNIFINLDELLVYKAWLDKYKLGSDSETDGFEIDD